MQICLSVCAHPFHTQAWLSPSLQLRIPGGWPQTAPSTVSPHADARPEPSPTSCGAVCVDFSHLTGRPQSKHFLLVPSSHHHKEAAVPWVESITSFPRVVCWDSAPVAYPFAECVFRELGEKRGQEDNHNSPACSSWRVSLILFSSSPMFCIDHTHFVKHMVWQIVFTNKIGYFGISIASSLLPL